VHISNWKCGGARPIPIRDRLYRYYLGRFNAAEYSTEMAAERERRLRNDLITPALADLVRDRHRYDFSTMMVPVILG